MNKHLVVVSEIHFVYEIMFELARDEQRARANMCN